MANLLFGQERRDDPTIEGTPAHLAAFVRGVCVTTQHEGVRVFKPVPGFRVPDDGIWTINGLFRPPGYEMDLREGDVVQYTVVTKNPDDDRPDPKVSFVDVRQLPSNTPTSDRVTGAVHQPRPGARPAVLPVGRRGR